MQALTVADLNIWPTTASPALPTIMAMLDSGSSLRASWQLDLAVALLVAGLVMVGTSQIGPSLVNGPSMASRSPAARSQQRR